MPPAEQRGAKRHRKALFNNRRSAPRRSFARSFSNPSLSDRYLRDLDILQEQGASRTGSHASRYDVFEHVYSVHLSADPVRRRASEASELFEHPQGQPRCILELHAL